MSFFTCEDHLAADTVTIPPHKHLIHILMVLYLWNEVGKFHVKTDRGGGCI